MSSGQARMLLAAAVELLILYPAGQAQRRPARPVPRAPNAREIAQRAMRAAVYVRATDEVGRTLISGSGFYERSVTVLKGKQSTLDRIVTNRHVVAHAAHIYVSAVTSSLEREVKVLWLEDVTDLALLTINASGALSIEEAQGEPLTLSNRIPEIGDSVFAVGNPQGLEGTFSSGIVSGIRRQSNGVEYLQITAPISPGSSGGPVLDQNGEVIGVVVSQLVNGQNLNFAIPIRYVRDMVREDTARAKGERNDSVSAESRQVKAKEPPPVVTRSRTEAEIVAAEPHWVLVIESNAERYYFFPERITVTSEGNVRAWIKQVPKLEQFDRDSQGRLILKSLMLEEFNCNNRTLRFVQTTDFTYSGEVNTTYDSGTGSNIAWKASIGGEILDFVCAASTEARKKRQ